MRLFVALTLPERLREELSDLELGMPGARWVAEQNLHLTLRFIGAVDGAEAHDIDELLAGVRMPAFTISLGGLGFFGDKRKPRALWASVAPNGELIRLRDKVEQAVVRAGQAPQGRKFKPHVTLARFSANPGPKLQSFLTEHALYRSEAFTVDRFTLFSSFLSASGAIYRPEVEYELEPARATRPGS